MGAEGSRISRSRCKRIALPLAGAVLVLAMSGAAIAAVVTGPDLSGEITGSVSPARLPRQGSAPASLSIKGSFDYEESSGPASLSIQLDRQLAVDAAGLPACKAPAITGVEVAAARRKCKSSLLGSGSVTLRAIYPESPPVYAHSPVLFFSGGGSRLLMYTFIPGPVLGPAGVVVSGTAKGHRLEVAFPRNEAPTVAFAFRFGRTWQSGGKAHGFLAGRCAAGNFRNRITLGLPQGQTMPAVLTQACTGAA
jgi:hypothetical protein